MSAPIEIFTDGACKGNPGVGGWGAVLRYKDRQKEICGGEADTTNNRMELTAVIFALETLKKKMSCAVIYRLAICPTRHDRSGWKLAAEGFSSG